MEIILSIAVQLVVGQTDYLVKVDMPIFGIFLLAGDSKIATALNVRRKQVDVTAFLWCENDTVALVHKRLKKVHGNNTVDRSTVSR